MTSEVTKMLAIIITLYIAVGLTMHALTPRGEYKLVTTILLWPLAMSEKTIDFLRRK